MYMLFSFRSVIVSNIGKLVISISFLFLVSCSSHRPNDKMDNTWSAESLNNISRKKFEWMIQKNIDSLVLVMHDEVRYIHSNGWLESKNEMMDNLRSGKLAYRNIQVIKSEAKIYKNTGTVVGEGIFSVSLNNQPLEIHLLFTEVYITSRSGWQCISRHACKLP